MQPSKKEYTNQMKHREFKPITEEGCGNNMRKFIILLKIQLSIIISFTKRCYKSLCRDKSSYILSIFP